MLIVYSKSNCNFCDRAKNLLNSKNIEFTEVKIDEDSAKREWLISQGHRSVPQIYLGETLFVEGGFHALEKLTDEQLRERLDGV
jgi:glutaredoxin